jgi:CubicO group peptidase (beta-lactamase class C family)
MKTIVVTAVILAFLATAGCGPGINELKMVEYAPQSGGDFAVSTPQAQGVDPLLVARLYYDAEKMETLYGLLVIRNGKLIAEKYFSLLFAVNNWQWLPHLVDFQQTGRFFFDIGYGYQWWSAGAGAHTFDFAWGHGGQLIVLLHKLNMVIVTTADPLYNAPEEAGWKYEGAIIDVVGRFIQSLPADI